MTKRWITYLLTVLAALWLTGGALAQSLGDLLPAETFLAFGTSDLNGQTEKLQPFIDEFERLELGQALAALFPEEGAETGGESGGDLEADMTDLAAEFEGLGLLDLLGQEAWVALSASSFNPLPSLTLLARLSPEASAKAAELLAEATSQAGVESLSEGEYTFYQERLDDAEDSPVQVLAYAQADDLLALSTNPDTLRGVLRQLGGSGDPSFTASEGYAATLGQLEPANFYSYLDYAQVAQVVTPFAQTVGFPQLIERITQAFETAGVSTGVVRVTDSGLESEGLQALNRDGGDASLYALLSTATPVDPATATLAPQDALAWTSATVDLQGWWDYLNEIAAAAPELGGSLDSMLGMFLGLDLRTTFFNWAGSSVTTVTTGVGEVAEPGVPSSNLLGDAVYIVAATDEAAAQTGLDTLLQSVSGTVASFADPSGGAGNASTQTEEIAGVTVNTFTITEGISLSYAVANGYAYIGTTQDGLRDVLEASAAASLQESDAFTRLTSEAPQDAGSLSVADNQATLSSTAAQLVSQVQMMAGLGGASELDFEAVEAASSKLEAFLQFVAERLGSSIGYAERSDGAIRGYSETQVTW